MMFLRFLVTAACLGITTSFVRISRYGNTLAVGRSFKIAQESDSGSVGDFIESIRSAPQRISDSTQRMSERIQAAPQQIADSTKRISDKIQAAPQQISDTTQRITDNIQATPGKISRNVKQVTDAVIYFPSNVTATVAETQSSIQEQADDVKRKVKALSPMPFINSAFSFSKNLVNTAYELKDGKINGQAAFAKLAPSPTVKIAKVRIEKNQEAVYEEAKESFYTTLDNINEFGRNVVATAEGVVATVERVQQFPDDISRTKDSVVLTAEILQKDIAETQQKAVDIGKVVWKVVTLEAAKETYDRTEKQYQSTVKYVTDTTNMLQTNPTALFTGGAKEKVPPPVVVVKPPAPVVSKDVDSALGKIWGALKVTKAGLDVTVSTVVSASNGVKGLKQRIDKSLAQQATSENNYKRQLSGVTRAPSSISPIIDNGELLDKLDSSEATSSSSSSSSSSRASKPVTPVLDDVPTAVVAVVSDIKTVESVEVVKVTPTAVEVSSETLEYSAPTIASAAAEAAADAASKGENGTAAAVLADQSA